MKDGEHLEISADDLIALVSRYNPKTNQALIRKAYDYGSNMHADQRRHSGSCISTIRLLSRLF